MTLRSIPAVKFDADAYYQEIANNLHDPVQKALTEIRWHGTEDYQKFIARDGFAYQQALLKGLRMMQTRFSKQLAELNALKIEGAKRGARADKSMRTLNDTEKMIKAEIEKVKEANDRLTLALMHYLERNGDAPQTAQPVFNITNEITVEPAEIAVNLPPRHTVTNIERNMAGEITRAEQIETSI